MADVARVEAMAARLEPLRHKMVNHELWDSLTDSAAIAALMEVHCFAVWDFMTLVKALQRRLTCVEEEWRPPRHPELARLMNEIVLDEESDMLPGRAHPISHAELYVEAMRQVGADTGPFMGFVEALRAGGGCEAALEGAGLPAPSRAFVQATRDVLRTSTDAEIAAFFAFGREGPIPAMFHSWVSRLAVGKESERYAVLKEYLERHIEVDGDVHGPLAHKMVALLCGHDACAWAKAEEAAAAAMRARIALWDGALGAVRAASGGNRSAATGA